ncbi:MAG: right-handed parallel beta-helix repeat-containing protein [Ignavibacteriae bacterium]|nr:right-handed parallel beta-helix repeat-containing protein [Ignavibacteriota bacterium]
MKTKTTILVLAMLMLSLSAFSQQKNNAKLFVGSITKDTVWSSDVIISTDVTVPAGKTLTINAGVSIYFVKGATKLIVNGRLVANGLPNQKVVFTSNEVLPVKGDWKGIIINTLAPEMSSVVTNADVQFAIDGITVNNTTVSFNNTSILNCSRNGLNIISGAGKITRINNCEITKNDTCGVYVENSVVKVNNSSISNNPGIGILVTGSNSNTEIKYSNINKNLIYGAVYRQNSVGSIRKCNIWDNYLYGIAIFGNAALNLDSNNIYNNYNNDQSEALKMPFNYLEWRDGMNHPKKTWSNLLKEDTLVFTSRRILNITYKKDADYTEICGSNTFFFNTHILFIYTYIQDLYSTNGAQVGNCPTSIKYGLDMSERSVSVFINTLITDYNQLQLVKEGGNLVNSRAWVSDYYFIATSTKQFASFNQIGYIANISNCWLGQSTGNDTLIYQYNPGTVNFVNPLSQQLQDVGYSTTRLSTALNSPNGEEIWETKSQQYITWQPQSSKDLKLEYTTNDGINWLTIANNIKGYQGYYKWMVPDTLSQISRVRISDMVNASNNDFSDTTFKIIPQNSTNATAFSLIAPTNFSTDVAVYPRFEWQAAFAKNEGGTYILRYGTDANFTTGTYMQVDNLWNTFYYPEYDLALDSIYYWKVYAVNSNGSLLECIDTYQFQSITANPIVFNKTFGNRTLNRRNSPYKLLGNFTVDLQHRFTVPAGITINMNDSAQITVKGEIRTLGTQTDSVKLKSATANVAGKWKGIKFVYGASDLKVLQDTVIFSGSAFYYTSIINTGLSSTNAIDGTIPSFLPISIYIQNCYIGTNSGFGIVCGSESIIKNSIITLNGGGVQGGKIFKQNTISSNSNYGVDAGYCRIFENNIVLSNSGFGAKLGYSMPDSVSIKNNIIKNNTGTNTTDKYGILTNNMGIFESNSITNNTGSGINGGLTFYNDSVAYNTTYGINATSAKVFIFEKVNNNGGYGIQTDNPIFYGIRVLNNSNFGVNAINSNSLKRSVISNNLGYGIKIGTNLITQISLDSNTISNNTGQNTTEKYGIMTNMQAVFNNNNVSYNQGPGIDGGKSFTNDSVYYNIGNGIQTSSTIGVNLTNSFLYMNNFSGVYIYGSPLSIQMLNCNVIKNVGTGISIVNTKGLTMNNCIVTGDTINNSATNPPDFYAEIGMSVQNSSNISINNSVFKNWWAAGLSFFNTKQISIKNDSIINNKWLGIYATGGDTLNIDSSEVIYNGSLTNNDKGGGIYLNIDHATITSSLVNYNKSKNGGGLYINSFSPFIYNNTFYSNQCSTNGGAIFTGGTSTTNPTIVYNTIVNNSCAANTGGGIYIGNTSNSRARITRNIISENFGHGIYGDPDSLLQNNITYNKYYNGSAGFALKKTNAVDLNATYNWWGTRSDQIAVENMIYHKQDSSALGLVTFQPFLGSPSTQAPGQVTQATTLSLFNDSTYSNEYLGMIMIGQKVFMQLLAVDANPFARDVTPIRIKNLRTSQSIEALALESGIATGNFRDTARVMTSTNFNLNQIGGVSGDTILFFSTITTTVNKRLIVTSILAPQLISPINNAVGMLTNPSFVWRKVTGATGYRFQLATDSLFSNIVVSDSSLTDSTKAITGLTPNTNYYWRLNSINGNGNGSFSEIRTFKTLSNPSIVMQSYPANGTTSLPTTITFKWFKSSDITDIFNKVTNKKTDNVDLSKVINKNSVNLSNSKTKTATDFLSPDIISKYWFEYSTDSTFTTVVARDSLLTDTIKTVAGLNNITKYYWRVKAKNEIGWGGFSANWNFTTIVPLPAAPTLLTPVNNSVDLTLVPTLDWSDVPYSTSYRVQVSTSSLFTTMVYDTLGLTTSQITVPSGKLNTNTQYYWRVNSTNEAGTSAYSSVWIFTTSPNAPNVPVLSTPANNALNQPVNLTFKWYKAIETIISDGPDAISKYWFEYSLDSTFAILIARDSLLTDTTKTINGLNSNTKYYWRVKAKNQTGWSGFSNVWNFTTVLPVPAAPVLTTPANNSTGISLTPAMTWGTVSGATSYRIQVSSDSLFGTTQWDTTGVTAVAANVPAGKLTGLTKYYWRVNGTNAGGTGAWSTAWNFRTLQNLSLNLKVYLEGFWDGATQVADTTTIYLANSTSFVLVDSAKIVLSTTGTALVNFTKAPNGSYYVVVNHRNHLETWSALGQSFVTNVAVNYDFTTAANKAYGDNMKQVGSVWVLYGGDANRDGSIDASDIGVFIVEFGNLGYLSCDFNGDEDVNASDILIISNNFGLIKITPGIEPLAPETIKNKKKEFENSLNNTKKSTDKNKSAKGNTINKKTNK